MLIFETRAAVQMALEHSETTRRVLDGDELALARTHYDANGMLPRLFALIRNRLSPAGYVRRAELSATTNEAKAWGSAPQ